MNTILKQIVPDNKTGEVAAQPNLCEHDNRRHFPHLHGMKQTMGTVMAQASLIATRVMHIVIPAIALSIIAIVLLAAWINSKVEGGV